MWIDRTRDLVTRIRFLTMCMVILWAFWGLVQMADASREGRGLIWSAPDADAVAMLANLSWDDDTPDGPAPAE